MSLGELFNIIALTIFLLSAYSIIHFYLKRHICNKFILRNTIAAFLILLILWFNYTYYGSRFKTSYYLALYLIPLLAFNIYALFQEIINKRGKILRLILKFTSLYTIALLARLTLNYTMNAVLYGGKGQMFSTTAYIPEIDETIIRPGYMQIKNSLIGSFMFSLILFTGILIADMISNWAEQKKQEKELEKLKLKEQEIQTQLDIIQAKLNPHFLYNSLNSIAGLALVDGEKTRESAIQLSNFLRFNFDDEKGNIVSISEEIKIVKAYLAIEKIRFDEYLDYEIHVDSDAEAVKVPKFLLQPMIENAIKHGLTGNQGGKIKIEIKSQASKLFINIYDNGREFPADFKISHGLKSVYKKLDLFFPDRYEIAFYNNPDKHIHIAINL